MLWLIPLALVFGLIYWELILAEGAHLGPRVVAWTYDVVAPRYDRIKNFDLDTEAAILGLPLAAALVEMDQPRVLDVAAGTGRTARALLRQPAFDGTVVGLDLSLPMLAEGRIQCAAWPGRVAWLRGPADRLPFPAAAFDAVVCLEALEFFADARAALAECLRVLRPGGRLLLTNRIGLEAWLIPGKTFSPGAFRRLLRAYPLQDIRVEPWQVDYDLAWAVKRADTGVRS
jgi:SAM-dependent methyltransferase